MVHSSAGHPSPPQARFTSRLLAYLTCGQPRCAPHAPLNLPVAWRGAGVVLALPPTPSFRAACSGPSQRPCPSFAPARPPCRTNTPPEGPGRPPAASSSESTQTPAPHQPATLKPHLTGRRSRSDSPRSEGAAADEQPLKRQNSMGTGGCGGGRLGGVRPWLTFVTGSFLRVLRPPVQLLTHWAIGNAMFSPPCPHCLPLQMTQI